MKEKIRFNHGPTITKRKIIKVIKKAGRKGIWMNELVRKTGMSKRTLRYHIIDGKLKERLDFKMEGSLLKFRIKNGKTKGWKPYDEVK